jgi:hypothetical protein
MHLKKAIVSVADQNEKVTHVLKSKIECKIGLEYGYKCNNIIK